MEFGQGEVLESSSYFFELEHELGKGTCSVVWKANRRFRIGHVSKLSSEAQVKCDEDFKVAVKIFKNGEKYEFSGLNEAKVLLDLTKDANDLGRPEIVQILDFFYHKDIYLCLVYELLDFSLSQMLQKFDGCGLPVYVVHRCARDMFTALTFLQDNRIVHGDIKLSNVMWSGDSGLFKLVDFGLCFIDGKPYQPIQSCGYQAPEVQEWNRQLQLPSSEKSGNKVLCGGASDVWSTGCVLAYLYLGKPLYNSHEQQPVHCLRCQQGNSCVHEENIKLQVQKVLHGLSTGHSDNHLPQFIDFLTKLMKCKPSERLVPAAALQHSFLTNQSRPSLSDLLFLPTRVLQLCNVLSSSELIDAEEVDDIALDIEDECKKYGKISSIHIPSGNAANQDNFGKVYVEFQRTQDCEQAQKQLMGRTFNNRVVITSFFPIDHFVNRHFY